MSEAVSTTGILVKRLPAVLPATVVVTASAVGNPGVITSAAPHLLNTGDVVLIAGHTGAVPALAGPYSVKKLTATTFSIPVNITTGGTGGTLQRSYETIGEITKVTPPGYSRNKIPVSTHNEETEANVLGMLRQRDPAFSINYVGGNLTHQQIVSDIVNNVKNTWQVAFKSGITFSGAAYVQQFMLGDAPLDAAQTADVILTWAETAVMVVP